MVDEIKKLKLELEMLREEKSRLDAALTFSLPTKVVLSFCYYIATMLIKSVSCSFSCRLQDNEAAVSDSELIDLREEVAKLSCMVSQMNMSKAKLIQADKSQVSALSCSYDAFNSEM